MAATAALQGSATPQPSPRALALDVARDADWVIVRVTGRSAAPMPVRYTLAMTGASSTRHTGKGSVGPNMVTLSTLRFKDRGPWRVRLEVEEGAAERYAIERTNDDC